MITRKLHSLPRLLKNVAARSGAVSRRRKRVITAFAEKIGFVYLGHVDQHKDNHHIIRGLTVSTDHQDDNYCVGSFDGYDISLVDRLDVYTDALGRNQTHRWIIAEIALQQPRDIPHMFLGSHQSKQDAYQKLFTAFSTLSAVPLGTFEPYAAEFTHRYGLFAAPSHFIEAERYIDAATSRILAAHFWPMAIEVYQGSLYIYSNSQVVSSHLLDTMLKNGLWLAKHLDEHDTETKLVQ